MSNPPKYRCTLDEEFHTADYFCDKFDDVLDNYDMKLNSTSTNNNTIEVENKESNYSNIVICTTDENGEFLDVSKYKDSKCLIICNSLVNDKRYFYSHEIASWSQLD